MNLVHTLLHDAPLHRAIHAIERTAKGKARSPVVRAFFHEPTFSASYVIYDQQTMRAAIIDPVLDFDQASGRTSTAFADDIVAFVEDEGLTIDWLLETHAHADHLSAAQFLKGKLGGKLAIGRQIVRVQDVFGTLFNEDSSFARDGSQFDMLIEDGDTFEIGELTLVALHVPGHTPADMAYVIGNAVFVGDTMFMPDYGTARTDFPGGDAHQLFHSIRRLMKLPAETRVFLCHDYKAPERDHFAWETTMGAQVAGNVHVHDGVTEDEFVAMRTARDAALTLPRLILPSVQVNMRGGRLPDREPNGVRYLKLPLNTL